MRIEYHPAIEGELRKIINYYNQSSLDLGSEFLNELEKQIIKISSMPNIWIIVEGDVQRSLMERFPYVIYFRVVENKVLRVTVIKHQRRHPSLGIRRK